MAHILNLYENCRPGLRRGDSLEGVARVVRLPYLNQKSLKVAPRDGDPIRGGGASGFAWCHDGQSPFEFAYSHHKVTLVFVYFTSPFPITRPRRNQEPLP